MKIKILPIFNYFFGHNGANSYKFPSLLLHNKNHRKLYINILIIKTPCKIYNMCISFISGLILGIALVIFVCVLSDECSSTTSYSSSLGILHPDRKLHLLVTSPPRHNYQWSFVLAVLAFLASEVTAVFCLLAFLKRFSSEVGTLLRRCKTQLAPISQKNNHFYDITLRLNYQK